MELFKLNSSYQPAESVRKFESLVWVEKYLDPGEFQLVIKDDIQTLLELPLGTLISHNGTREVMIVENHEFVRDDKKGIQVTISGRSIETFFENRYTLGGTWTNWPGHIGQLLMQNSVKPGSASSNDALPNVDITGGYRQSYTSSTIEVKVGTVYERVREIIQIDDLGFKNYRPNFGQPLLIFSVHDGNDRRNSTIFYAQREDLMDANYFWSIKGYKNYVWMDGSTYDALYRAPELGADVTGWERRLLYEEAQDLTGTYNPSANDEMKMRAHSVLKSNSKLSLIQAKIAPNAKPKFKIDYDVGDLVKVYGEFGSAQDMRVTEHTLTIDEKGIQGYPSLTIL